MSLNSTLPFASEDFMKAQFIDDLADGGWRRIAAEDQPPADKDDDADDVEDDDDEFDEDDEEDEDETEADDSKDDE